MVLKYTIIRLIIIQNENNLIAAFFYRRKHKIYLYFPFHFFSNCFFSDYMNLFNNII